MRLINENIAHTQQGNATISGVVEVCELGQWASICVLPGETIADDVLMTICRELGYSGKIDATLVNAVDNVGLAQVEHWSVLKASLQAPVKLY